MSHLENLKSKLKVKPTQLTKKKVEVVFKGTQIKGVAFHDLRNKPDLDINIERILEQVKEINAPKTTVMKQREEALTATQAKVKKTERIQKMKLVAQNEVEGEAEGEVEVEGEAEGEEAQKEPVQEKKRKTKQKAIVPPEAYHIYDESQTQQLLEKPPQVIYKANAYMLNNREKFIQFINTLFRPYREEFLEEKNEVSCDTIGNADQEVSLLSHQKLVRDYINLYTPYRGLLLYHSLGSGKSLSSIAIAEGMKETKKVYVLIPASLEPNYRAELKKYDAMYRSNQCWEWIDLKHNPTALKPLAAVLGLTEAYITKKGGAWMVNPKKPSNCPHYFLKTDAKKGKTDAKVLEQQELDSLNDQINTMIEAKYTFLHYNGGITMQKLKKMTDQLKTNLFSNSVVIIDEAHNFISRIVNRISKEKPIIYNDQGVKEKNYRELSLILYDMLMSAENCRIVFLSGTPIINYPNEIGILYNILRGYIKTFEFVLKDAASLTEDKLTELIQKEHATDYVQYAPNTKLLSVTKNPFDFENVYKKQVTKGQANSAYVGVAPNGVVTDANYIQSITQLLRNQKIEVAKVAKKMYKALPDDLAGFNALFFEEGKAQLKNVDMLKRRILGLTSYYRSAQEALFPDYEVATDFHVVKVPMSMYQFGVYEEARQAERVKERNRAKRSKIKKGAAADGLFAEPSSNYRMFSRMFCNFVMPKEIGRPMPEKKALDKVTSGVDGEEAINGAINGAANEVEGEEGKEEDNKINERPSAEIETDDILENAADPSYKEKIANAIKQLEDNATTYLSKEGLKTYSPKYASMLEHIDDPDHPGLHLVYSQFRSMEGIAIFKCMLEANGYEEFRLFKDNHGVYHIKEGLDFKKPMFALYTGTETDEDKEMIRKIYNNMWDKIPESLASALKKHAPNNQMGEIIKVLMITASGAEGINLRNTRYVHIMESYWHPTRSEQVIGRARRICSHQDLPKELQTVEVFMYLMTFTPEQINSDLSIELKKNDLSKREYEVTTARGKKKEPIPFTSDEALYEISVIKDEFNNSLKQAIKESSIDCSIYAKRGNKEQLHCMQFGEPDSSKYAYTPSIEKEETDKAKGINKTTIEWRGVVMKMQGKEYIYRKLDEKRGMIYDKESYLRALEMPGVEPVIIGEVERDAKGNILFK